MRTKPDPLDPLCTLEAVGRRIFETLPSSPPNWVQGQISSADSIFLSGLVCHLAPNRFVEIGIASGWSGVVVLNAVLQGRLDTELHGIDLSETYYLDKNRKTGAALDEVFGESAFRYKRHLGDYGFEAAPRLGTVDLAFIDGHHMHPWATIDFLSLLPFLTDSSAIVLHDINLSRMERHKRMNRGPLYFYNLWPGRKLTSGVDLPMIGAVFMEGDRGAVVEAALDCLYTPWEIRLSKEIEDAFIEFLRAQYPAKEAERVAEAVTRMNALNAERPFA